MEQLDNVKINLRLLLKKKVLFIATAALIITAAVIGSYAMPKKYEAQTTVFIEKNVISSLVEGIAIAPSMDDRLRVLIHSMKSRSLLYEVIKALDMDLNVENQAELAVLIEDFQEATKIKITKGPRGGMDLFTISYRDKDPKFALDYVNTLVKTYIEKSLSGKRDEAYGANTFLSEQIEFFKNKLDIIDSKIVDFRREKGIFVSIKEDQVVSEVSNIQENLENLKILKMELKAKKASMAKQLKDGSGGLDESATLGALQKQLNELLLNYTEDYPDVIRIRGTIEALKQGFKGETEKSDDSLDLSAEMSSLNPVYQELTAELVKVESEIAAITAKENHLEKLVESKKEYLRDIPAEKKKLADMERQKERDQQIYEQLTLRHGQSEVSKQMEVQSKGATFNIVDPAVLPTKPVSPNRVRIILFGLMAGFAGAFGLVFLVDLMDTSVKTLDTLKTLGFPVLAVIPAMKDAEDMNRKRKKDIQIYSFAGGYLLIVLVILALELLGLTYLDQFVTKYIV
ncbi:MAG: chain length-determining protein [Nitrospira sp.]|nr:chain length-determining protein [Nitrospira sp.]